MFCGGSTEVASHKLLVEYVRTYVHHITVLALAFLPFRPSLVEHRTLRCLSSCVCLFIHLHEVGPITFAVSINEHHCWAAAIVG